MKSDSSFGAAALKEEGAPIDPIEAVMFTGPGATDKWFAKQCEAWFAHQRRNGVKEAVLRKHPYYTRRTP